ncbi:hypothetical protein J23TS9_25310 [Paenibacillus sp. J23TS9]|uniref:hypothetical protein n=1 Tax=Paenibacillus sp. J23TS9 TaxID=2807193 RepID=UPI001B15113C|nr:hypothetical protein [Paenibacillus sp. J23TS9]GIP27401.1 hypothetical protein J23TS9_25310 [Paenibacillus sp. J23TS9]
MNIGSMIRGLLGETKAGDAKQLDMKTGQVVRGVVLSVSEDGQEAVVQIQGVKVRAALETPMQAGQATLLQVQPPAENGMMVLKPLAESPYLALPTQSLADVLSSLGLADTDESRTLVQAMQSSGVPLTKENAELFSRMMLQKPASVPAEQWIQSAAIALQRGLPVTAESIRGLQQAVFGAPIHELLAVLDEHLETAQMMLIPTKPAGESRGAGEAVPMNRPVLNGAVQVGASAQAEVSKQLEAAVKGAAAETGSAAAANPAMAADDAGGLQPLMAKLQQVLQQLRTAPLAGTPALASPQGSAATAGSEASPAALTPPQGTAAQAGSGSPAAPEPNPPQTHAAEPWVGRILKLLGAEHEQQGVRGAGMPPAPVPEAAAGNARPTAAAPAIGQGAAQQAAGQAEPGPATLSGGGTAEAASAAAAAARTAAPSSAGGSGPQPPAVEFAAGHDLPARALHAAGIHAAAASLPDADTAGMRMEHEQHHTSPQDTLKGILLQLVNHDEAPQALKEAAQQLISHLTGQQLLLNTDRTAPFAQVTLFLPLNGPDGQETASVQIQSRRGPKGELDASNCRLWFDLQMKHLGQTLVDVQVVDRIVSLKVHNDNDWAGELLVNHREEISGAMESLGYQLLTLKTEPLPEKAADSKQGPAAAASVNVYVPQSYKGVDFKV